MNEKEKEFGIEVNEAHIWASERGAGWWNLFRRRHATTGRIRVLVPSVGGDRVFVHCGSRDDAKWLRETFVANGCPERAMKVSRPISEAVSS